VSDDEPLAALLTQVLGQRVGSSDLQVSRPSGGGWSNDTVIITLSDGLRVVVRRAPERAAMFPTYDLRREHDCLRSLDGVVPVPPVIGADLTGDIVGRPAFVMGYVEGRVPSDDRPTFVEAGWLHDANPTQQRQFHRDLLAAIAAINASDPPADVVVQLRRPGPSACRGLVDDLEVIWHFDAGQHRAPVIDEAFDAAQANLPTDPARDRMLWGDARPANVICGVDGFEPVALVDFELAAWGPPELDVTWLAEMNRMRTVASGIAPLPGFLDDDGAVAFYESCAGYPLAAEVLRWATLFNALKVSVLMHRHLRVMVHEGRLADDHRIFTDNVSTRRCTDLLHVR
jgi:aminoglycoside phosphotransferase (APT) family kinase protein